MFLLTLFLRWKRDGASISHKDSRLRPIDLNSNRQVQAGVR
jgi:hypothetical protein